MIDFDPTLAEIHRQVSTSLPERKPSPSEELKALIAAWEALPGGRNYSNSDVQRWLIEDMKPAIDNAREAVSANDALSDLVDGFSADLLWKMRAADRKYGFGDAWKRDDWRVDLIRDLDQHIVKGDPRDVAAYCAFAWHHKWNLAELFNTALAKPSSPAGGDVVRVLLDRALSVLDNYADPTGYTDNNGEQFASDEEQHPGILAKECAAEIRAALSPSTSAAEPVAYRCAICGGEHDNDALSDICTTCEQTAPWRDGAATPPAPAAVESAQGVKEAVLTRNDICRLWQYVAINRPSLTVEGFTNLLLCEIDDRASLATEKEGCTDDTD